MVSLPSLLPLRQLLLVCVSVASLIVLALLLARLARARQHGLSLRMQIFLAVGGISGLVIATFSFQVIDAFFRRVEELAILYPGVETVQLTRETLADWAPRVTLLGLLLVSGSAVAAGILGRALGDPIQNLTDAATRIAAGQRTVAFPEPFGREARELTLAFEDMRRELADLGRIEEYTTLLSHELKNPTASIRAVAEVLRDGALDDPVAARHFVDRILTSTAQMEAILDDLLALARLDSQGVELRDVVQLDTLVEEAVRNVQPRADVRGVRIQRQAVQASRMRCDSRWLSRAVANLLDNAVTHTPSGGVVTVSSERQEHLVQLAVANPSPGLPPYLREHLFEKFVTGRDEGTGLGLALVRSVAEAHGGEAHLLHCGPPQVIIGLTLPYEQPRRRLHDEEPARRGVGIFPKPSPDLHRPPVRSV
jgi:signal transduction histidine kinase